MALWRKRKENSIGLVWLVMSVIVFLGVTSAFHPSGWRDWIAAVLLSVFGGLLCLMLLLPTYLLSRSASRRLSGLDMQSRQEPEPEQEHDESSKP